MFWGVFFGWLLGLAFGSGILGLICGIWLGHRFDLGLAAILNQGGVWQFGFNKTHSKAQQVFFDVTFSVMGYLAKADGVISQKEIKVAERMMARLNMGVVARKAAMEAFRRGKQPDFDCQGACLNLHTACHRNLTLIQLFLQIQQEVALADGVVKPSKQQAFEQVCSYFNMRSGGYAGGGYAQHSAPRISEDYAVLEVSAQASDAEVKKAYRRQMAAHHPDRLIAKGLPEEMVKVATEKTQAIRAAYDRIKTHRGDEIMGGVHSSIQVSASILSADCARLGQEVAALVEAGIDSIHFDVMDMHYVNNLSFGPMVLNALKPYLQGCPVHVHLMVECVEALIAPFVEAGATTLMFHPSTVKDPGAVLSSIRAQGVQAGLVVKPDESLEESQRWLDHMDRWLIMSVMPGWGGQSFLESSLEHISSARQLISQAGERCVLEVDGGIGVDNVARVRAHGAQSVVVGSGLLGCDDYKRRLCLLKEK